MLGFGRDNPGILIAAADYLRSWILFIAADGTVQMFDHRDANGGIIDPRGGSDLTYPPPPD
jgi:hypothetical protein